MQLVLNTQPLDIFPFEQGFIYSKKDTLDNGNIKVSFFYYDRELQSTTPVAKRDYLALKFGDSYREIVETVGDFITCSVSFFQNGALTVAYDTGDTYIFNQNGEMVLNCTVRYQDASAQSPAVDEKHIWFVVPERNAVVSYSPSEQRVLLRVGGGRSKAFNNPVSITKILDSLYICNADSCNIRVMKLQDYSVKDYKTFQEPVYKYFRVYDGEYALLESGLYSL